VRDQRSPLRRLVMGLTSGAAPLVSPILLAEVELFRPMPDTSSRGHVRHYDLVRVLVRIHGEPLGVLQLPIERYGKPGVLESEIEAAFGSDIDLHLDEDGVARTALPFRGLAADLWAEGSRCSRHDVSEDLVTVVVPTVGRESLRECVLSILSSTHRNLEVILVDNAPDNPFCAELVRQLQSHDPRVHYAVEPLRGSSRARNLGLRTATGSIVAFTDDDVVVDAQWVQSLVNGFRRTQEVVAVTGLTLPLNLETSAEIAFEQHGGFGRGFRHRLWDLDVHRGTNVLYPYTLGFGASSNNMAVLKDWVLLRGGFDERFGPATPTYASEDGELVLAMVLEGHQVSYEPAALVRHAHRSDWGALKWQVFTYSAGKSAMITKCAISDWNVAYFLLRRLPQVVSKAIKATRRTVAVGENTAPFSPTTKPPGLLLLEYLGFVYGPVAYLRAAWPGGMGRATSRALTSNRRGCRRR